MSAVRISLLTQVAGVVFVGLLLASLAAYLSSRQAMLEEITDSKTRETLTRLSAMQGTMEHFLRLGHAQGVSDTITDLSTDLDLVNAFVADVQGLVIASSQPSMVGSDIFALTLDLDQEVIETITRTQTSEIVISDNRDLLDGYISICDPNSITGLRAPRCGFLFYRADLRVASEQAMGYLHDQAFRTIAGFTICSLLILVVFHRVISRRVERIIDALSRFSEGDRRARSGLKGEDELVTISEHLDEILDGFAEEESALVESERLKQAILDSANAAIIYTDREGFIQFISAGTERILGYTSAELVGKGAYLLHDPDEVRRRAGSANPERVREFMQTERKKQSVQAYEDEWTYLRKDGSAISVGLSVSELTDDQGRVQGYLALARDLAEDKRIARSLQLAERVFQSAAEAIVVSDAEYRIVDVNPAYCQLTGYDRDEAMGQYPHMEFGADAPKGEMHRLRQTVRESGIWTGELLGRRKTNEVFPLLATISVIRDADGTARNFIGICKDISQQKAAEDQLQQMAYFDTLTGLPNRTLFKDRLKQALSVAERAGTQVALMFIDLDRFKYVNDTLGHDVGDELLIEAARRLKETLRRSDTVARLGGDEFTLIIADARVVTDLDVVARKVIASLEAAFRLAGQEVFIGASIGVAVFPDDGREVATLVKNADTAMYRAKQAGRGTYRFFTQDMNERNRQRLALESKLHRAIDAEAFELFYQPQINLENSQVVGVEALLRWRESDYGMFTRDIIRLAEETGLIDTIGRWVRNNAVRQLKHWREEGYSDLTMSLNVSSRELKAPALADEVTDLLQGSGLPASAIRFELTEQALMDEALAGPLDALARTGVSFVIDEFGIGYSSFRRLQELSVRGIKIDRSFIRELDQERHNADIIRAIVSLGRSLELDVLADGVETLSQHQYLIDLGCAYAQGYLYSRAVPADAIGRLLENARNGSWRLLTTS